MFTSKLLYSIFGYYDADRFIPIPAHYGRAIQCIHTIPFAAGENVTDIYLAEYAPGCAGKCSTCGKVYYANV